MPRTQPTCFPSTSRGRMRAPTSISSSQFSVISALTRSTSAAGAGRRSPSLIFRIMSMPRDDPLPRVNLVSIFLDGHPGFTFFRCLRQPAQFGISRHLTLQLYLLLDFLLPELLFHLTFDPVHNMITFLFDLFYAFHELTRLRCLIETHGREESRHRQAALVQDEYTLHDRFR